MISRRKFLEYVRNKVAVGVMCSGMLSDALDRNVEVSRFYLKQTTHSMGFIVSAEMIEDDLYGTAKEMMETSLYKKMVEENESQFSDLS